MYLASQTHYLARVPGILLAALLTVLLANCTDNQSPGNAEVTESAPRPAQASPPIPDADLIVIGAGLAGLSAALEASSLGRSVLVIDMASVFGGHAVMSAGGMAIVDTPMQREQDISDSPDLAYTDFVNWGEDINGPWARYYVDNSREMIYDWATRLGVIFNMILKPPGNTVPRMHFPQGLGPGLIAPIMRKAVGQPAIDFRWNSRADSLISQDGRVIGVNTTNTRTGTQVSYHGHAVVVATGGYQSNLERVRENWRADLPEPGVLLAGSGWNSRGSGLDLASEAGATLEHLDYTWNYVTGVPDPRYDNNERGLRFFIEVREAGADVWLNDAGERFVNECLSPKFALKTVLEQPGKSHWMLFDSRLRPHVSVAGTGWTPDKVDSLVFQNPDIVKTANSLGELAVLMDMDASVLSATVDRYNEFIDNGQDEDFRRFGGDTDPRGGCPQTTRLDQPPYYALKRYPLTRKSMGGIKIGPGSRVLDSAGQSIPGLYAAGEATGLAGINGKAGLEGTFLGPSLVTGRVAGRSVAEDLSGIPVIPVSRDTDPMTPPPGEAVQGQGDCTTCHNIPALIGATRQGYQHFELAHELILERDQACTDCHTGMLPFDATRHRITAMDLVDTCEHCHGSGGD